MAPTTLFRLPTRQCLRSTTLRSTFSPVQPLSQTTIPRYPRKGYEDKDSINPEATEYSKSGTDDAAAKQEEAAFDPSTTDPQEEKDVAGKGNEGSGNPLDVSPANPEVSKQRGTTEGGAENSGGEGKRSGGGSPKRNGAA